MDYETEIALAYISLQHQILDEAARIVRATGNIPGLSWRATRNGLVVYVSREAALERLRNYIAEHPQLRVTLSGVRGPGAYLKEIDVMINIAEPTARDRGLDRGLAIGLYLLKDSNNLASLTERQDYEDEAFAVEEHKRQFSPFEFTAAKFNSLPPEEAEAAWEEFNDGIADGISMAWDLLPHPVYQSMTRDEYAHYIVHMLEVLRWEAIDISSETGSKCPLCGGSAASVHYSSQLFPFSIRIAHCCHGKHVVEKIW